MFYFVYILSNSTDLELYKGYTQNLGQRIIDHNRGNSQFTSVKKNWKYIAIFEFINKSDALIFEKRIKRLNRRSIDLLIASDQNVISKYSVG